MPTNTIRLHRVYRASPERLYRAFLDADAKAKWMPPHGFTGKVLHSDPKVGGSYRMSFTDFSTGQSHAFGGTYVELKPNELVRYTDKFDDPHFLPELNVTVTLKKVSVGTDVEIVQEGLPAAFPVDACYHAWNESLMQLTFLVEHDTQA